MESYKITFNPFVKIENIHSRSELLACRVCLATDSKLFDLFKNQLPHTFGDLTGTQVSKTDGLPQHICHICYVLLQKSAAFRAKCRRVHVLLQDAMVKQPSLTTAYIETLDRSQLKLPFTHTNALIIDFPPASVQDETVLETYNIYDEQPLVKCEPFESSDDVLNDWNDPSKITYEFVEIGSKKGDAVGTEALKKEKEQIDISNETFETYTTENRKEQITESEVKKKPRKKKKAPPKPKADIKKIEMRRKRPCNMKFIEDFADFAETYNCEVFILTKEQQLKEVEERKETEYFKKSRFKCTICYKGFMNVSAHKNHMATHDEATGDNLCDVCMTRFPLRTQLSQHRLRCHKFSFICKTCKHVSKVSASAKNHYKWHEGFKYECKPCDKQFNSVSTYFNHKRQYHHSVTCDVCKETVFGSKGLEEHNLLMHKITKYPCDACRKHFESQEAFCRHLSPDGACNTAAPCIKCGENFASKPDLHDHREAVHSETLFRCEKCPSAFPTGRRLAKHWGLKHSEPTYMCEICAKVYTSKQSLRKHLRNHTGEKPFPCPICPKRFGQKEALKEHTKRHTGDRPYKCVQCERSFKSQFNRHKHVLLAHRKERPYECRMCDKSYVIASDLKMHIRTIHMKIPRPPRNPPNRRTARTVRTSAACATSRT